MRLEEHLLGCSENRLTASSVLAAVLGRLSGP
jgi:hypothetical protein